MATKKLTTGYDVVTGTASNDSFIAKVLGNSNTFQSGDEINGGKGTDTLNIVLGQESQFAISAETKDVEIVSVRSQSVHNIDPGNSGDNNVSNDQTIDGDGETDNVIDAHDMVGVKQFWNTDSRADLVIEDIRTNGIANPLKNGKGQILTESVTIGWKNTDPSSMEDKVDYEVYFSPESLRADVSSTLSIEWMDTRSAVSGGAFLEDVPYRGFSFTMNGKDYKVESDAIDAAKTYDQLVNAVKAAVADLKGLENIVVSKGEKFVVTDPESGDLTPPGYTVLLTATDGVDMKVGKVLTDGTVPADSGLHTSVEVENTVGLITSKVILDNVGRESEAGDLVIGSMSTRSGVEKFKVDVLRSEATRNDGDDVYGNWVGSMSSTNEKLQEVIVTKNEDKAYLYVGTGMESGNNLTDARAQPKASTLLNTDGLTDVRLFDASLMTGNVKVGANITAKSIAKYQNLSDDGDGDNTTDYAGDDLVSLNDDVTFEYLTGSGSDAINLVIDSTVTASNSNVVTGRHDFSFNVEGNAGSDTIQVKINPLTGSSENWYNNQAINDNVTVSGGDGDDTIKTPGAGNMYINGDAGNDVIYADNTGSKATYVFNAAAGSDFNVDDLMSDKKESAKFKDLEVKVDFKGITNTVTIVDDSKTGTEVTDLMIQQAIKKAINQDFELKSLLTAEDGAGRTLLVKTDIDGVHTSDIKDGKVVNTAGSLQISFSKKDADGVDNKAKVTALLDDYITSRLNSNDESAGSNSITLSDNQITGGAGTDVIVLGTTVGSNDTVAFGGNFGNDTIVNFVTSGAGADVLDFTAYYGISSKTTDADGNLIFNTGNDNSGSLNVVSTDLATIEREYKGDAGVHVVVNYSSKDDVAQVYSVDTGVVTLVGSIDLADTAWSTLTDANFV